jgi:hypothetical protein
MPTIKPAVSNTIGLRNKEWYFGELGVALIKKTKDIAAVSFLVTELLVITQFCLLCVLDDQNAPFF